MALIRPTITPFPISAPPPSLAPSTSTTTTITQIRFSRWNNANAEKFNEQRRTLKEIEDDLRRHRRHQSALSIANLSPPLPSNPNFRSIGTPSAPSAPSIPGKKSKYSKPDQNPNSPPVTHPAFRKLKTKPIPAQGLSDDGEGEAPIDVRVAEGGVSYVVPGAPFEYMYSYTETPKAKPVALREPPMTPFGPQTMGRPWTGRKPLPASKKKLREFDSFEVDYAKKGMKPVQRPGPFLPGAGPKNVWSREEVLGEELIPEEVEDLVEGCRKSKRQLNMGRDGLTHNMLDNIHAHWKRRRVCKIKCKGVCTVDLKNVCQQLEEKTGGKIIYQRGGAVFLFRGRNYNYRTRPRFPLMLWKPIAPVYPRLVKRVPVGLTFEEAHELRRKGRELPPICKLAKNGVYVSLVDDVREAFEACELVRINCQGFNPSDYRKIGGKLKDLVPCVLISFENEHILVWRGREWNSSFIDGNKNSNADTLKASTSGDEEASFSSSLEISSPESVESVDTSIDVMTATEVGYPPLDGTKASPSYSGEDLKHDQGTEKAGLSISMNYADNISIIDKEGLTYEEDEESLRVDNKEDVSITSPSAQDDTNWKAENDIMSKDQTSAIPAVSDSAIEGAQIAIPAVSVSAIEGAQITSHGKEVSNTCGETLDPSNSHKNSCSADMEPPYMQDVLLLLRQAVEGGSAVVLDETALDADLVYKSSVSLAQVAPSGPVFRHRPRKISFKKSENQETAAEEVEEDVSVVEKKPKERARSKTRQTRRLKGFLGVNGGVLPQGSLGVDELAKLLA